MTPEMGKLLKDGSERIRQREAWLTHLYDSPDSATGYDVRRLVERVRMLERDLNDYYRHCTCFAGTEIARRMHQTPAHRLSTGPTTNGG